MVFDTIRSIMFFIDRRVLLGFSIPRNSSVIDIGSGDKPFWRGDVFLDDLDLENVQRNSGKDTITHIGTFINGNIAKTKFKDKVFDFSYCTHLLEHVENPSQAIEEITRISKAGYIEVPNALVEFIKPFISHLWLIFLDKDTLVFVRKSKNMHEVMDKNGLSYQYLFSSIHNPFIRLAWKGKIKYKILDSGNPRTNYNVPIQSSSHSESSTSIYLLIVKILRFLFVKEKNINPNTIFLKK